ncbi:hypothetical protein [Parvularcula dongshanensis]|uniref:Uncharacterized protein n=1 Tax=Parvularcula dongshanensis TaxID=1173995 RepID=A0A840I542_9PROT|nr:hypothetical protein [Parvularcula dongshanensis]MBB4659897.1 hypothetical protein [Parvularcula dongshanensis]
MKRAFAVLLIAACTPASALPPPDPPARQARGGSPLDKFPGPQDGFMIRLQSLCTGTEAYGTEDGTTLRRMGCRIEAGHLEEIELAVVRAERRPLAPKLGRAGIGLHLEVTAANETVFSDHAKGRGTFTRQAFGPEEAWAVEIVPGDSLSLTGPETQLFFGLGGR